MIRFVAILRDASGKVRIRILDSLLENTPGLLSTEEDRVEYLWDALPNILKHETEEGASVAVVDFDLGRFMFFEAKE